MKATKKEIIQTFTISVLITAIVVLGIFHLILQMKYIRVSAKARQMEMQLLRQELKNLKSNMDCDSTKKLQSPKPQSVEFEVTAYCPCSLCCGKFSDGVTATGTDAYTKGVAVDPKVIPLGSTIHIPGYGTVIADDVGGAIKGEKLDVRFKTHKEAKEWGRQKRHITILRKP